MTAAGAGVEGPDAEAVAEAVAAHSDCRLGRDLKIRSMVAIAGEVLPFVWPMRNFIHHNPLYGLEHLGFEEAIELAKELFHAKGYLRRTDYQGLMRAGKVDPDVIAELVAEFLGDRLAHSDSAADAAEGLDLAHVLFTLMTQMDQPSAGSAYPTPDAILAQLRPSED